MWAGVAGAPVVWTCQHIFGMGATLAGCGAAGSKWGVPIDTWTAIATSLAGLLALGGMAASLLAYRAVRDSDIDADPPAGRIYFMSICGIVVSPLFLAIVLMSGIGSLVLTNCRQG